MPHSVDNGKDESLNISMGGHGTYSDDKLKAEGNRNKSGLCMCLLS